MAVIKKLTVDNLDEIRVIAKQYADENRKLFCSYATNITNFPEEIAVIENEPSYNFGNGICTHSIVTKTDCPHLWRD